MRKINWFVFMLLVCPWTVNAEVYKWKDDHGDIVYSDIPPPAKVAREAMKTKNKSAVNAAPAVTDVLTNADAAKSKQAEAPAKDTQASVNARKKACDHAKENLAKLNAGGSIYKENDKGERQYLDETSIKNEILAANKEIDLTCL